MGGVKEKSVVDSGNFISCDTKIILVDGENSGEIFTACEDGYMGSTFRALEIRNIDVAFFCYFVSTQKEHYGKNKRGSTIPHLNKDLFYSTPIPLPPLSEQKRIVARLDSLFEKLDAAAEILQAILAGGELRRSAMLL